MSLVKRDLGLKRPRSAFSIIVVIITIIVIIISSSIVIQMLCAGVTCVRLRRAITTRCGDIACGTPVKKPTDARSAHTPASKPHRSSCTFGRNIRVPPFSPSSPMVAQFCRVRLRPPCTPVPSVITRLSTCEITRATWQAMEANRHLRKPAIAKTRSWLPMIRTM